MPAVMTEGRDSGNHCALAAAGFAVDSALVIIFPLDCRYIVMNLMCGADMFIHECSASHEAVGMPACHRRRL